MQNPYASPEPVPEDDFASQAGHLPVTLTRVDSRVVARRAWEVYTRRKWRSFAIVFTGIVLAGAMLWLFVDITGWQLRSMENRTGLSEGLTALLVVAAFILIPANIVALTLIPMMRGLTGLVHGTEEPEDFPFPGTSVIRSGAAYVMIVLLGWGVMMAAVVGSAEMIPKVPYYAPNQAAPGAPPPEPVAWGRSDVHEVYMLSTGYFLTLAWLTLTLPGFWLIAEKRMDQFRALAFSVRMIGYNIPCVLRLWLRCGLLLLAGAAALGVGLFWALPFVCVHGIMFCMLASGEKVELEIRNGTKP